MRINFQQVGNRARIIFLSLFLSLASLVHSQDVYQTISYVDEEINASLFSEKDIGHKILNSLAVTNVKGLKWVYVGFEGRILIQTEESEDGQLFAYSKLIDYTLSGDHFYRDFPIDSLLLPKAISGKLAFMDKGEVVHDVPIEILLTGGVIDLGNTGLTPDSLTQLTARIEIDKYIYTRDQYESFIKTTRLINFYYAYSEVLKLLVDEYTRNGIGRKQPSSYVFNAYHEISRVNKYIRTYGFEQNLNLLSADPLGFIKLWNKAERLEKRSNTIFEQVLQTQEKGSVNEKLEYCGRYAGISEKYSQLARNYQPYIAAGFGEVMRIFPDSLDKRRILQAEAFYDVFNKLDLAPTPQCIYDEFIDLAGRAYEDEKFVEALDYIYNATFIDQQFEQVATTSTQQEIYLKTLDKLMSAYLQIAIMAYRSGNFTMADQYYQKATEMYQVHIANLSSDTVNLDLFVGFIEQQVELAYGFLADQRFYEGLGLIDRASSIASANNVGNDDAWIDSAYAIAYPGIYKQKLDSIGLLIAGKDPSVALEAIDETQAFASEHDPYLPADQDARLTTFARSLFNHYYAQGVRQMKGREPENALFSFLEAESINERYLQEYYPELDSLIYHSTVPVILDITSRGEFEVWANRMDAALLLYQEAVSLQVKYEQEENEEINAAIDSLKNKIDNQSCVNQGNYVFELKQKTKNRINQKKYQEVKELLDEARESVSSYPDCSIEDEWIAKTETEYEKVFTYLDDMNEVERQLREGNYSRTVSGLLGLVSDFKNNDLSSFGLDAPDMYTFVKETRDPDFCLAVTDHFVNEKKPLEAMKYLDLARQFGASPKHAKPLQEEIARELVRKEDITKEERKTKVEQYTGGDKWYRYFRAVYLSNG